MIEFLKSSPAVFGLLGALMYAAPKLGACIYSSKARGVGFGLCLFEFFIAIFVGTVAAEVFTPWGLEYLAGFLKRETGGHDLRAASVMLGLLANPAVPRLVAFAESRLPKLTKGPAAQ